MQKEHVRIYGLFGHNQGVELNVEKQLLESLKEEELLDYGERCYEIKSLIKAGSQQCINVRLIPNPELYQARTRREIHL